MQALLTHPTAGRLRPPALPTLPRPCLHQWDVLQLPNGNYRLQNRGVAVGAVDGLLFAFLIEGEALGETLEWSIKRDEHDEDGISYMYVLGHSDPLLPLIVLPTTCLD